MKFHKLRKCMDISRYIRIANRPTESITLASTKTAGAVPNWGARIGVVRQASYPGGISTESRPQNQGHIYFYSDDANEAILIYDISPY